MKNYGLIGNPLSHSFSKGYFTEKFHRLNIHEEAKYDNFEMENLEGFHEWILSSPGLVGLNVTIPFKEKMVSLMDELSIEASTIGAVNTIKIIRSDDRNKIFLVGYNTDADGFRRSILPLLKPVHTGALILGTGGASKAVAHILDSLYIPRLFVSRTINGNGFINYDDIDSELIKHYPVIINTTPLGTYPNSEECPPFPYELLQNKNLLFDLVYNPDPSKFLRFGADKGAAIKSGLEMLQIQADLAWEIWSK